MICACARGNTSIFSLGRVEGEKLGVGVIIGSIPHIPNVNTYVLPTKH